MVQALFKKFEHNSPRFVTGLLVLSFVFVGLGFATQPASAHPQWLAVAQAETTVLAVVSSTGSAVVDQPNGATVATLDPGAVVTAFGRTEDSTWIAIRTENKTVGWMKTSDVVIYSVETLAVLDPAKALPNASQAPTATATAVPPTPTVAPTPSPTPQPTLPPTPTATPTQAAANPPTATPAQNSAPRVEVTLPANGILGVVGGGGAALLDQPNGNTLSQLDSASTLSLVGRNEASDWLLVVTENGVQGWVKSDTVVAFDVESLPVASTAAVPAAQAQSPVTSTEATTTTVPAADEAATATVQSAVEPTATPVSQTSASTQGATGVQIMVQTEGATLRVRSGPGTNYGIIGGLANGERYPAIGRNADSSWVQIDLGDGSKGWVSAAYTSVSGTLSTLPVVQASAPSAASTPATSSAANNAASASSSTASAQSNQSSQTTPPSGLSGKIVVSSGGGGMFYVYDLATGVLTPVTTGYDPEISPDGTKIAYTRMGGENGVYVIDIDGSNERKLYGEGELLSSPKWNADGSKIVFTNANGKQTCRTPGFGICLPDIPRFENFDLKTIITFGLARITVDDKEYRDLAVEGTASAPDWNNDNIIYRANRGFKITMDKPSVEVKTVTEDAGFQDPDLYGNRIVYQSKSGNHWEIMVMNDDASGQTYLTRPATALVDQLPNNVAPAWSPDGKYIVFLGNRAPDNNAGDWHVWVMNADGSNQRQLPINIKISYGYAQEQMVSWGK